MARILLIFLAALVAGVSLRAQTASDSEVTISTDRPAVAESSLVVPQGGFQAENGFLATNTGNRYVLDFPETDLRYGLFSKTEIRLEAPDYFSPVPRANGSVSGFGDLAIGVKQQLGPIAGFDLSAIVFLSFPTGASGISSHGYDPGIQVPWSRSLSKNWTAGGQAGFYWPTVSEKHDFTGEATFYLDRQLSWRWDAFVEYAGDFAERGGSRQFLHFGTSFKITHRQQIDFHVAAGLSRASPTSYVGFGYSFLLFPK